MKRRFFAKAVVQTSNMDCGVAALKCVLDGYNINVNYEYLRDACKTDVNGTSIDRIEDVLNDIGFDACQIVVPKEQLCYPGNTVFPAIAVVNIGQNITHFVVIWRQVGAYLQIVDPAQGRYWIRASEFIETQLYLYQDHLSCEFWLQCFSSWGRPRLLNQVRERLGIEQACFDLSMQGSDENWQVGAKVDATLRFISELAKVDKQFSGPAAQSLFTALIQSLDEQADPNLWFDIIPQSFWSCQGAKGWYLDHCQQQGKAAPESVFFSGAVLLTIQPTENLNSISENTEPTDAQGPQDEQVRQALNAPITTPLATLIQFIKTIGKFSPAVVLLSALVVSITTAGQAVAFKLLFEFDDLIGAGTLRTQIALVVFFIVGGIAVLNLPLQLTVQKLSRRLEDQFRIALYEKLPRLKDEYFSSRLLSDLIERNHSVASIENIPAMAVELVQSLTRLLLIVLGLIYLAPNATPWLLGFAALCLVLPFIAQRIIGHKDLITRTLGGTLTRHYSNALLGLFAVKVHSGENTVLAQQQESLTRWAKAANVQRKTTLALSFIQELITYACAAALIAQSVSLQSLSALNILYVYWLLQMPTQAESLFLLVQQYPLIRNIILRLQEPLSSAEDDQALQQPAAQKTTDKGFHIQCQDASFSVANEMVLRNITLEITAGKHIAIVGASGAGKSTFISSLLGFAKLEAGQLLIDGIQQDAATTAQLRQQCSWLDPQVYLFDKSIIDNITYGSGHTGHMGEVLDEANLWPLIEGLPDSIHTDCGEAGSQLSGGEGQRIRLARALNKPNIRLALLDEPFRGLDKPTRQQLMNTVRQKWLNTTLICVTHDVSEALQFDHVVVFDKGSLVEQGNPQHLMTNGEALKRMIKQEDTVANRWLNSTDWHRMSVAKGKVSAFDKETT